MQTFDQPIIWYQLNACGQELSDVRMGKKCDLRDWDRGMIVGARQGGLSLSETADLLGFSRSLSLLRMVRKTKKHPVSGSSVGRNAL